MVDTGCPDDAIDRQTLAPGVAQTPQHQDRHAFAADIAVGIVGKTAAFAIGAKHTRPCKTDMAVRHEDCVDRTHDGAVTASADRFDRAMQGDQRAGTGGFDRLAWSAKVQQMADAVRTQ